MPDLVAIPVAALAAFLLGAAWYATFGVGPAAAGGGASAAHPPSWKLAVELLRCLVLAAVVAGLVARCGIDGWTGGLVLGLALWVGFPAVLWTGALVWEGTSPRLAALHAGDWLVKLLVVAGIAGAWPR